MPSFNRATNLQAGGALINSILSIYYVEFLSPDARLHSPLANSVFISRHVINKYGRTLDPSRDKIGFDRDGLFYPGVYTRGRVDDISQLRGCADAVGGREGWSWLIGIPKIFLFNYRTEDTTPFGLKLMRKFGFPLDVQIGK